MKKDKEKVLDEVWTEDRVRAFLDVEPKAGENPDFHKLLKAYQSMRADDFALFLDMFLEIDGDLNATDPAGRTVLSYVQEHRKSGEFAIALQQRGAQ